MKNVFIGLIIIALVFIIIDIIYMNNNTCRVKKCATCSITEEKCGILKDQMNIEIKIFDYIL